MHFKSPITGFYFPENHYSLYAEQAATDVNFLAAKSTSAIPASMMPAAAMPAKAGGNSSPSYVSFALSKTSPYSARHFTDFLTEGAHRANPYFSLAQQSASQKTQNISHYIDAMFPVDRLIGNSFLLDTNSILRIRQNPRSVAEHGGAIDVLLPALGLQKKQGSILLCEPFSFKQASLLHTANGRQYITQMIRSLAMLGNGRLAIELRDAIVSIALRYKLAFSQILDIAASLAPNYWQLSAKGKADEQTAKALLLQLPFQVPIRSIFTSHQRKIDHLRTALPYADFLLGNSPNSQGYWLYDLLRNTNFTQISSDSWIFQALFSCDQQKDTTRLFRANPSLRALQRSILDKVLSRFALSREHRQIRYLPSFSKAKPAWLSHSNTGKEERALLLKIIQSLYSFENKALAIAMKDSIVWQLKAHGHSPLDFESLFTAKNPEQPAPLPRPKPKDFYSSSKQQYPFLKTKPSLGYFRPAGYLSHQIPSPGQDFGFTGNKAEQFAQYLNSELFDIHTKQLFSHYSANLRDHAAWVFPLPKPYSQKHGKPIKAWNPHIPYLDEPIIKHLLKDDFAAQRQYQALDNILNHFGMLRQGSTIIAGRNFTTNSALFRVQNEKPNDAQVLMTRIIRHLAATSSVERDAKRVALAQSLQRFLISHALLLSKTFNPATLAHWHYATNLLTYQRDTKDLFGLKLDDYHNEKAKINAKKIKLEQDRKTWQQIDKSQWKPEELKKFKREMAKLKRDIDNPGFLICTFDGILKNLASLYLPEKSASPQQQAAPSFSLPAQAPSRQAAPMPSYTKPATQPESWQTTAKTPTFSAKSTNPFHLSPKPSLIKPPSKVQAIAAQGLSEKINLQRFKDAQNHHYAFANACTELKRGQKIGHWIWFVFPQITGLGSSSSNKAFAIHNYQEAKAYMLEPQLKQNYDQALDIIMKSSKSAKEMLMDNSKTKGQDLDCVKFWSSLTLFAYVTKAQKYEQALTQLFGGKKDLNTIAILEEQARLVRRG